MPVPQQHKQGLERLLAQLTDEKGRKLASFLRNPQLQNALDELYDNPQAREEAKRNPKEFFKRKGAKLPDDVRAEIVEGSWSVQFRVFELCLGQYHSESGWGKC